MFLETSPTKFIFGILYFALFPGFFCFVFFNMLDVYTVCFVNNAMSDDFVWKNKSFACSYVITDLSTLR